MSTYLEPINDALFAQLTPDEQDAVLGGLRARFTRIGATQIGGEVVADYELDPA